MKCSNCDSLNESGMNFCKECGTRLVDDSVIGEKAAVSEDVLLKKQEPATNGKAYIDKSKHVSKLYLSYFLSILKAPMSRAEKMERNELTSGIITMIIYSLIIPLMTFIGLKSTFKNSYFSQEISFAAIVIKPFIVLFIILLLIGAIIFATLKIGKSLVHFKDVLSRFGAFLVVPMALFVVAFILSILSPSLFAVLLLLGLVSTFFVIPLIVYSFKQEAPTEGLDVVYCTLVIYIGIGILFAILGDQAFQGVERMINSFDPFGF